MTGPLASHNGRPGGGGSLLERLMKSGSLRGLAALFVSAWIGIVCATAAQAAPSPAEGFVSDNIHAGLDILNDKQLAADQRSAKFKTLLLGVTDLKRIALFTLGDYAAKTSQPDKDAFVAAFQNYATAVYRSYFQKYSGQTLNVTGSRERAPGDYIVATGLADPAQGSKPLEIDFRVSTTGPATAIIDIGVAGVWLVPAQRDDFTSFLGQHNGDVGALSRHLDEVAQTYR
jgi:phospholipid transport system substrate-binding protein